MSRTGVSALPSVNRQFTLAARPVGMPKESDFRLVETPLPSPGNDQILLRTLFLSVDPYMRGSISPKFP
jgi:NADPH-dependent curcumin reductase CurA